jgi:hypothetical protein
MKSGSWNDGRETSTGHAGQKVYMDFGLDRSSKAGNASDERSVSMGGSMTDLSHSLSGASAKQTKNDGTKSKIKEV